MRKRVCVAGGWLLAGTLALAAQSAWQPAHPGIGFAQAPAKQWVQMVSSSELTTAKNRPDTQQVEFLIQSGLHINSNTPHSHYLIPTSLTLDAPTGVQVAKVEYPPGVDYRFSFAPKEPVSVYTGEFTLMVQLHAKPGKYVLHGQLHYQACDDRACNPPKTLPVTLDLIAQ